jgi:N-acetylmuramoyl-L-alanine amidase/V8-like Glu-specific endopeptidase
VRAAVCSFGQGRSIACAPSIASRDREFADYAVARPMLEAFAMARIIIDAGHGGSARAGNSSAYGSRGPSGLLEKDVTLDIARHVVARLGGDAALTRQGDLNLPLGVRAAHAARDGADVFVSIHANSGPPEMAGPETWVHPDAGADSHQLAGGIQRALERLAGRYGGSAESRRGPMAVLSPGVLGRRTAACLVEVDYLSNPRGEQRLGDPGERATIGAAIAGAIREHVGDRRYGQDHQRTRQDPWIEPPIDYNVTTLEQANQIWSQLLRQYGEWRTGVPASGYTNFPHSAICQLKLYAAGSSNPGYGTGFYIGREKILTCGHNFKLGSNTTTRVIVQPGHSGVSSLYPEREYSVNAQSVVHPRWWSSEAAAWDLAVLHVPGLPAPGGSFSLPNQSPSGSTLLVMCGYGKFPGSDWATQGQTMHGVPAESTRIAPDTQGWFMPIHGIPGHSGAPVFSGAMVVGVFTRMTGPTGDFDPNYNYVVRLDPERLAWINGM